MNLIFILGWYCNILLLNTTSSLSAFYLLSLHSCVGCLYLGDVCCLLYSKCLSSALYQL